MSKTRNPFDLKISENPFRKNDLVTIPDGSPYHSRDRIADEDYCPFTEDSQTVEVIVTLSPSAVDENGRFRPAFIMFKDEQERYRFVEVTNLIIELNTSVWEGRTL